MINIYNQYFMNDCSHDDKSKSQEINLFSNIEFKVSDRVKMEINADTLLKQIVTMIAIKLATFYAIKQTNFSFFIEILVTGVRVLMVHMID